MPASAPVMVQCRTCSSIIQARCIKRHEQSKKHLRAQESRSRKVASSLQKASPNPETTLEQEVSSNSIPLPTFEHKASPNPVTKIDPLPTFKHKASPNPVTNLDPLPTFEHKASPNPVTNLDPLPTFEQKASPYSAHGWTKAHDIRLKNLIQHLNTTEAGWSPTNQFIYDLLATDCFPRLPFRRLSQISRRFYDELQVDGIHGFKEEIDVMDEVKEVEKVHQDGTTIIFRLLSHSTWEGTTNYSEEDDARISVTTSDDNMMILKRYSSDAPDVCETYFARPSSISVRVKSEPATIIVFKDTMQEERLHAMVLAPIQINRARSHHQLPHVAMSTRSTASIEAKDLDTLDPGRLIVNSVVNAFARHLQSLLDNDTQNDGQKYWIAPLDFSAWLCGKQIWDANANLGPQYRLRQDEFGIVDGHWIIPVLTMGGEGKDEVGHYWVAVVETENNQEVLVYDSLIGSSCVAAPRHTELAERLGCSTITFAHQALQSDYTSCGVHAMMAMAQAAKKPLMQEVDLARGQIREIMRDYL